MREVWTTTIFIDENEQSKSGFMSHGPSLKRDSYERVSVVRCVTSRSKLHESSRFN